MKSCSLAITGMVRVIPLQTLLSSGCCIRIAWVLGAADPSSGTVAVHEVIRGLGALLREGWKPLRTIVIASWDAEEVGQL